MNQKITFDVIVNTIVEKNSISKSFARSLIKELTQLIKDGLIRDNVVNLAGFGIFKLHSVPERTTRNIQNGQPVIIPAHQKVLFKPEKYLRELINKQFQHIHAQVFEETSKTTIKKKEKTETDLTLSAIAESLNNMIKDESQKKNRDNSSDTPLLKDDILGIEQEKQIEPSKNEEKVSNRKIYIGATLIAIILIIVLFLQFGSDETEKTEITESKKPVIENTLKNKKEPLVKVKTPVENKSVGLKIIKSIKGDNLWNLAYKNYGDGYLWPLILEANRDKISDPDLIEPDVSLKVPVIKDPSKLSDKENRMLSKGHLTAYFEYKKIKNQEALNHLFVANKYDHEYVKNSLTKIDQSDYQSIKNFTMK